MCLPAVGHLSASVTDAESCRSIAVDVLMISREIKCSLSANSSVHVLMSMRSDSCLGSFGYKIQGPEPCIEIVSQLQRIFSYPRGQGAALQTNLPSVSLPD